MRVWAHLHLPRWQAYLGGSGDFDVISVKAPGHRVIYVPEITLRDCEFKVSESGRDRTLRTGQRNVHAWVVGDVIDREFDYSGFNRAVYDPWRGPSFVDLDTLAPLRYAQTVHMIGKDVYYDG